MCVDSLLLFVQAVLGVLNTDDSMLYIRKECMLHTRTYIPICTWSRVQFNACYDIWFLITSSAFTSLAKHWRDAVFNQWSVNTWSSFRIVIIRAFNVCQVSQSNFVCHWTYSMYCVIICITVFLVIVFCWGPYVKLTCVV